MQPLRATWYKRAMRKLMVVGFFFVANVAASAASANNTGIFGKTGRDPETGTCLQCHFAEGGTPPSVNVDGLDGLIAGGFADLVVTVTRGDATGGIADAACPDRCAGINVAVDAGGGTFAVPDGSPLQTNVARDEISHLAKSPFIDGAVTYRVALAGLIEGNHNLYVAANDVDGQDFTGDRVTTLLVPFSVGPPVITPPPDEGGCAQARSSGATLLGLVGLLGLLSVRPMVSRRRRRNRA